MEKIWLKQYPKGIAHDINPDEYASISEVFAEAVKKYSARAAYVNMGSNLSFIELDELSLQFAGFLQKQGLKKGDRIAIQLPNVLQFPVCMFGALRAGLIVVNTNPLYTSREMNHQFNDSGAVAIVILANFATHLQEILPQTKIKTVIITELGDSFSPIKKTLVNFVIKRIKKMVPDYEISPAFTYAEAIAIGKQHSFSAPKLISSDVAFLQYTGGTTGVSKGAMLTHRNIISNMLQVKSWICDVLIPGEEIIITALPLYHIFSLTVNCLCFLKLGGTNVLITNPKDIKGFIKTLKSTKFTFFTGVNTLFNALMNHADFASIDFSTLKISVAGGMALQKSVALRWMSSTKTKVIEGFGLTETSPVACCNPANGSDQVGTIGIPIPSTEIKVIDEDGKELGVEKEGELCIRGPQVMAGYWQKEDETKNVLTKDGWLKTGDIAIIEKSGFTRIVDRKKDMILVSGFNVFPNEVEEVAAGHPAVLECAVIGVLDEKSGEAVKLFVVKKSNMNVSESELIEFCRKSLVGYKVPRRIEFRTELPKTNVGKILRRALRSNE